MERVSTWKPARLYDEGVIGSARAARRVRRNAVQVTGTQDYFLVAISKAELAREHRAHMLLFVGVLGKVQTGLRA